MSSFIGQFKYTIDTKGRINIPAKFRKAISPEANETFVITRGMDDCIWAYPLDEWSKFEEKLRQLSTNQKDHRLYIRMATSYASESRLDKQGRIAIPQYLIDLVKIEKEILITGSLDKLEIWNPNTYEEHMKEYEQSYEILAEKIDKNRNLT